MTTITIDRAVIEQALEALEADCGGRCNAEYNPCWQREVAETLRAALAQQAEPVAVAERERIAAQWDGCVTHRLDTFGSVDIGASIRAGELVGPAQQAEPVEPVAIVRWNDIGHISWRTQVMLPDNTPLYTAPPQRPPLTDEKISDLWCEVSNTDFVTADTHVFARAVERAHGIGRQSDPQIEDRLARHGIPKP